MSIQFTKMQGLGNDFVVFDTVRQSVDISPELIRALSDRHYGVGCDQVLVITPSYHPSAHFGYRIFNADGTEVYQCGNGARCVGLFIQQEKLSDEKMVQLATGKGLVRVECQASGDVLADISQPNFDPMSLPFCVGESEKKLPYELMVADRKIHFDVVSVGNPHCVIEVEDITDDEVKRVGEALNAHPAFPEGVNVGFVRYQSRDTLSLIVYERGAGLTNACGSGACAAVAVGQRRGKLAAAVTVYQRGGALQVLCASPDAVLQLVGPAKRVFQGVWV